MKRVLWAVLALGILSGCGAAALKPVAVDPFDPAGYPVWNEVLTADGKLLICRYCHQDKISPRYATDGKHECLIWSCANCGATWRSKVAKDSK